MYILRDSELRMVVGGITAVNPGGQAVLGPDANGNQAGRADAFGVLAGTPAISSFVQWQVIM